MTLADLFTNIANAIRAKGGTSAQMYPSQMPQAIADIQPQISLQRKTKSYTPSETAQAETVAADSDYDGLEQVGVSVGAIPSDYVGSGVTRRSSADLTAAQAQVNVPAGYYESAAAKAVTLANPPTKTDTTHTGTAVMTIQRATVDRYLNFQEGYLPQNVYYAIQAVPDGTQGTPTAEKSAVTNHGLTVTPRVTNNAGYIDGGTKTGTGVSVSASELVSGSETKTENGTYDVTNLAQLVVNVQSGGTSKNTQVVQGTTRTTSSTATAIGAEMTVEKTGIYDVYWSAFRSSTSASYTYGTQLYIDGTAYGTENTTWSNHVQNNHLSNVSLTAGQKIRVRGRNSRGSSYYIYAPTLVIVES